MPQKITLREPPKGFSRFFYRMPIGLFKIGLGGIFGKRMLLLNHKGRKSGLPRQAVLEVVHHNPENDLIIISVGFGPKTQWYQNLLVAPETSIIFNNKTIDVLAEQISPTEGGKFMLGYAKEYPKAAKMIGKLIGYEVDGTDEDYIALGEIVTFMRLSPR